MGRLVRSRLKGILRGDSNFVIISCSSLVLYVICLYTFLHLNGYIGVKEFPAAAAATHVNSIKRPPAPYLKNAPHFDDGKIHEFENNVGQPADWDLRVKGTESFHFYCISLYFFLYFFVPLYSVSFIIE